MNTPRLGVASISVSISDRDGFKVRHGSTDELIFDKAPELCNDEWDQLFTLLNKLAGPNLLEGQ